MVTIEISSLIVSIGILLPIVVFAVVVERRFTRFWTAFWNLISLLVVGLSLLFIPVNNSVPLLQFDSIQIPLWLIPLPFAGLALIIGFNRRNEVIRRMGSSILTASVISPIIVAQIFMITQPIALLIIGAVTYASLFVIRERARPLRPIFP